MTDCLCIPKPVRAVKNSSKQSRHRAQIRGCHYYGLRRRRRCIDARYLSFKCRFDNIGVCAQSARSVERSTVVKDEIDVVHELDLLAVSTFLYIALHRLEVHRFLNFIEISTKIIRDSCQI